MEAIVVDIIPRWGLRNPVSMLSHLLGALVALAALLALVWRARRQGHQPRAVWALAVYGLSVVAAFAASALFHAPVWPADELVAFKKLDHAAIFVMIAGTGTALYGALRNRWAGPMIGVLWGVCLVALAVKMVVWPMTLWMTALIYVAVGWCALVGLFLVIRAVGWRRLSPLFWGAVVLTVGAVIFATRWPVLWPGIIEAHELFHLLVLVGTGVHFAFIYKTCTVPGSLDPAFSLSDAPHPPAAVLGGGVS